MSEKKLIRPNNVARKNSRGNTDDLRKESIELGQLALGYGYDQKTMSLAGHTGVVKRIFKGKLQILTHKNKIETITSGIQWWSGEEAEEAFALWRKYFEEENGITYESPYDRKPEFRPENEEHKTEVVYHGRDAKLVRNWTLSRYQIKFLDGKKGDRNAQETLKRSGWKWAGSQGAWQRQLNDATLKNAGDPTRGIRDLFRGGPLSYTKAHKGITPEIKYQIKDAALIQADKYLPKEFARRNLGFDAEKVRQAVTDFYTSEVTRLFEEDENKLYKGITTDKADEKFLNSPYMSRFKNIDETFAPERYALKHLGLLEKLFHEQGFRWDRDQARYLLEDYLRMMKQRAKMPDPALDDPSAVHAFMGSGFRDYFEKVEPEESPINLALIDSAKSINDLVQGIRVAVNALDMVVVLPDSGVPTTPEPKSEVETKLDQAKADLDRDKVDYQQAMDNGDDVSARALNDDIAAGEEKVEKLETELKVSQANEPKAQEEDTDRYVMVWSQRVGQSLGWNIERSYPLRRLLDANSSPLDNVEFPNKEGELATKNGEIYKGGLYDDRQYAWFERGTDPNKLMQDKVPFDMPLFLRELKGARAILNQEMEDSVDPELEKLRLLALEKLDLLELSIRNDSSDIPLSVRDALSSAKSMMSMARMSAMGGESSLSQFFFNPRVITQEIVDFFRGILGKWVNPVEDELSWTVQRVYTNVDDNFRVQFAGYTSRKKSMKERPVKTVTYQWGNEEDRKVLNNLRLRALREKQYQISPADEETPAPLEAPAEANTEASANDEHFENAKALLDEYRANSIELTINARERSKFWTKLRRVARKIPIDNDRAVAVIDNLTTRLAKGKHNRKEVEFAPPKTPETPEVNPVWEDEEFAEFEVIAREVSEANQMAQYREMTRELIKRLGSRRDKEIGEFLSTKLLRDNKVQPKNIDEVVDEMIGEIEGLNAVDDLKVDDLLREIVSDFFENYSSYSSQISEAVDPLHAKVRSQIVNKILDSSLEQGRWVREGEEFKVRQRFQAMTLEDFYVYADKNDLKIPSSFPPRNATEGDGFELVVQDWNEAEEMRKRREVHQGILDDHMPDVANGQENDVHFWREHPRRESTGVYLNPRYNNRSRLEDLVSDFIERSHKSDPKLDKNEFIELFNSYTDSELDSDIKHAFNELGKEWGDQFKKEEFYDMSFQVLRALMGRDSFYGEKDIAGYNREIDDLDGIFDLLKEYMEDYVNEDDEKLLEVVKRVRYTIPKYPMQYHDSLNSYWNEFVYRFVRPEKQFRKATDWFLRLEQGEIIEITPPEPEDNYEFSEEEESDFQAAVGIGEEPAGLSEAEMRDSMRFAIDRYGVERFPRFLEYLKKHDKARRGEIDEISRNLDDFTDTEMLSIPDDKNYYSKKLESPPEPTPEPTVEEEPPTERAVDKAVKLVREIKKWFEIRSKDDFGGKTDVMIKNLTGETKFIRDVSLETPDTGAVLINIQYAHKGEGFMWFHEPNGTNNLFPDMTQYKGLEELQNIFGQLSSDKPASAAEKKPEPVVSTAETTPAQVNPELSIADQREVDAALKFLRMGFQKRREQLDKTPTKQGQNTGQIIAAAPDDEVRAWVYKKWREFYPSGKEMSSELAEYVKNEFLQIPKMAEDNGNPDPEPINVREVEIEDYDPVATKRGSGSDFARPEEVLSLLESFPVVVTDVTLPSSGPSVAYFFTPTRVEGVKYITVEGSDQGSIMPNRRVGQVVPVRLNSNEAIGLLTKLTTSDATLIVDNVPVKAMREVALEMAEALELRGILKPIEYAASNGHVDDLRECLEILSEQSGLAPSELVRKLNGVGFYLTERYSDTTRVHLKLIA